MFLVLLLLKRQILISTFFSDAVKSLVGLGPEEPPPSPTEMARIAQDRERERRAAAAAETTVITTPPPGVSWQQMEEEERTRQEDEALRLQELSLFPPPPQPNLLGTPFPGQDNDRTSLLGGRIGDHLQNPDHQSLAGSRQSVTGSRQSVSVTGSRRSNAGSNAGSNQGSPKKKV